MLKTSFTIISILHRSIWIGQIGYLASLALEIAAIFLAGKVVLSLPDLRSFSEIAYPSYVGLVCAILGAAMAIVTLRTDSQGFSDD